MISVGLCFLFGIIPLPFLCFVLFCFHFSISSSGHSPLLFSLFFVLAFPVGFWLVFSLFWAWQAIFLRIRQDLGEIPERIKLLQQHIKELGAAINSCSKHSAKGRGSEEDDYVGIDGASVYVSLQQSGHDRPSLILDRCRFVKIHGLRPS